MESEQIRLVLVVAWLALLSYEDIRHHSVPVWQLLLCLLIPGSMPSFGLAAFTVIASMIALLYVPVGDLVVLCYLSLTSQSLDRLFIITGLTALTAHMLTRKRRLPLLPFIMIGYLLSLV